MPLKADLTSEELEEIRQSALGAADPLGVAADLADAVDNGRLADQEDAGDALTIAAGIAESRSKLDAALRYADRAIEAFGDRDDAKSGAAKALRARILFRAGRDDEAVAALEPLRPQLMQFPDAPAYITAAMAVGGHTHARVAEHWLTEAVKAAMSERGTGEPNNADDAGQLFFLLQQRHRLRHALNEQHDQHDSLAERLETRLANASTQPAAGSDADLLFFPQAEFDSLLKEFPALSSAYGADWDEHRARLEKALVRLAGTGRTGLTVHPGTVKGLKAAGDPTDEKARNTYAELQATATGQIPWPPERNGACWCGSGLKYKKDCLPRSRS
ncbi:SEC-C domain-containing protein [Actinoplanes solisilvae]|uniref:SEC-C domain-containing protein n=1 Tax=Actinoplanes solisilvae TaxID=2486853 RepID=UPI000FD9FAAD|nr:SEC-C domain-containing protein [Actinoplanes solisilvae]